MSGINSLACINSGEGRPNPDKDLMDGGGLYKECLFLTSGQRMGHHREMQTSAGCSGSFRVLHRCEPRSGSVSRAR